ncbi:hypothetical protein LXL04_010496 [Taraxacum kok-saghyz]
MSYTIASLSSILRNSIPRTAFAHATQTHVQILIHNLCHDVTLQTDLLLAYSRGSLPNARKLFDRMLQRNMHSWNIMISAYAQNSMNTNALNVFLKLLNSGNTPDHYSLPPVLKACTGIRDFSLGLVLHGMVIKLGFQNYVIVGSTVLDFYSKCGNLNDAKMVFKELPLRDSVTWNSMISGLSKAGLLLESLNYFKNMIKNSTKMDSMTIPTLLNTCAKLGDITKGKEVHGQVLKNTNLYNDTAIKNSLINLYSKCGCLYDAEKTFHKIKNPNLVTWTTMISCYGHHGKGEKSLRLFYQMKESGLKPNNVTLTAILSSCSHSGLINEAKKIFNSIKSLYKCDPSVEHYACMVDLLSRVGRFNKALDLINSMMVVPPASVWGALLAGSLVHRNIEIGEMACFYLFEMEPMNASNYTALCSLYDSCGMWSEGLRVRLEMRKLGLGKIGGCSWVLIGGEMCVFYKGEVTCEIVEWVVRSLPLVHRELDDQELSFMSKEGY